MLYIKSEFFHSFLKNHSVYNLTLFSPQVPPGSPLFQHDCKTRIYPGIFWPCLHKNKGDGFSQEFLQVVQTPFQSGLSGTRLHSLLPEPGRTGSPVTASFHCTGSRLFRNGKFRSRPGFHFSVCQCRSKKSDNMNYRSSIIVLKRFERIFLNEISKFKFLEISMFEDNSENLLKFPN